jgi:low temperature requirement protein LtrA
MDLIQLVIVLIVIGVLLWLTNAYGGKIIDAQILKIINIVVIVAVVLWLLSLFVDIPHIRVGK